MTGQIRCRTSSARPSLPLPQFWSRWACSPPPEPGENAGSPRSRSAWPAVTREAHPWTRWWWLGSAVDKENLTRQLTLFQQAGIGGVEICPIYGAKGYEDRFIDFLSPQVDGHAGPHHHRGPAPRPRRGPDHRHRLAVRRTVCFAGGRFLRRHSETLRPRRRRHAGRQAARRAACSASSPFRKRASKPISRPRFTTAASTGPRRRAGGGFIA